MNYRDARRVLGTHSQATYTDIKRAYRAKARKVHPDLNPKDPYAPERFATVVRAKDFLMSYRSPFQIQRYWSRAARPCGQKCLALVRLQDVPKQPTVA